MADDLNDYYKIIRTHITNPQKYERESAKLLLVAEVRRSTCLLFPDILSSHQSTSTHILGYGATSPITEERDPGSFLQTANPSLLAPKTASPVVEGKLTVSVPSQPDTDVVQDAVMGKFGLEESTGPPAPAKSIAHLFALRSPFSPFGSGDMSPFAHQRHGLLLLVEDQSRSSSTASETEPPSPTLSEDYNDVD